MMSVDIHNISIFSFFSGAGFLDLGFEKNGITINFANEIHKPFQGAYTFSRDKMNLSLPKYGCHLESIEEYITGSRKKFLSQLIKESKKDSVVGFIGGPPCPDFSNGGKNRGHHGDNGRLTKEYVELISIFKPDFFLLENVKGLWKTEKHRAFYNDMKVFLSNNGYVLTDCLVNSLEFGVPQDRDRIMLFGINKKLLSHKNKQNIDNDFPWRKHICFDKNKIPSKKNWPQQEIYMKDSLKSCPSYVEEFIELTVEHWFEKNNVSAHPNSLHYFQPRKGLLKFQTIMEGDDSRKSFKRLHRWRYSPTTAYGNNEVHLHPYKDRRLSAAEALAIQSLPKEFELPASMSLTDMFKTIGNGVPYLLSLGIAKSITDYLEQIRIYH
ncbi:DNA cytosine methyltransferase [Citrobacter freundii]|uniref:DNA cytosine methyltransferase n=1 Tax=Citrobacter freundii TaxID=546 RepID=UPI001FFDF236|nr:DNA cytosine methyltransferase [Citrobacter freundii]MCT4725639.1 DNA cytosine methyltransferase [Citrobacter freundii]MCT4747818.1 DNA cytosine methyltransferase [Citrobacter freundii]MDT7124595.1 DNA cytosine methyltransferase [Citrobacter freundii]MDT7142298.1 DNA cytosine methyltransferase [Citrobacter freundii]MDT7144289.1 DNA cytosine methyltransferase [Citrobacter freundii]